jgi:sigma-B regulation protein RsbU (phosphoserine phosphatase)
MKTLEQRAAKFRMRLILSCLAALCVFAIPLTAQTPAPASTTPVPAQTTIHGVTNLDGPWRFHIGDDPNWANPDFDDSSWDKVIPGTSLLEQGIDTYSGYAWYRLRLYPPTGAEFTNSPLALLVSSYSIGQLDAYLNGAEAGHTRGMTDHPQLYQCLPFSVQLSQSTASANKDGSVVIAIRTWADTPISHGLLDKVQLGSAADIRDKLELASSRQWGKNILAGIVASFLFFCVAALAATLYLAQRHHPEYLWLALLCLSVTLRGFVETAFGLAWIPMPVFAIVNPWTVWIFIVVTLEFVLRFTGNYLRKVVRGMQIAALLLPLFSNLHWIEISKYLSLASQFIFCGLIVVMLFRTWRRGRPEAGVMLLPFFLAATADSSDILLDFAANRSWIPARFTTHHYHLGPIEYSTSTVTYLVFLGSLIAVIFYRFIRVSQEEQRSVAEIEAARSVQALLIPTQLPSNRNFVLESAYLPANGVGGDFFQVLPLKDDSMLIVVGDVSGKGLQAAMNASTLVGALRNELSHDPATVLAHLNQVMLGATSGPIAGFATCLCARIYPNGKMTIANAGHLSPYRDGREMELAACLPLGVIPNVEYEQADFHLKHGDRLTFLSDGVVEATDPKGELFGFERTQQVSHEPARYIAQIAQRFGQTDDITVVSLYFVPA